MKLKPCPFCGKKRLKSNFLGSFGPVDEDPVFSLWVIECKCGGQLITEGKNNAIKAWNKRMSEQQAKGE